MTLSASNSIFSEGSTAGGPPEEIFGVAGALAIARLMTTMLFGVRPTDPLVFGGVAMALMALMAVAASVVPSLRFSRIIRPANALRCE